MPLSLSPVISPWRLSLACQQPSKSALTKATLCLHGHKLYAEVWNDQPPLHTFLITQVLRHVSPSILGPRLVTTAFTVLLLLSVFGIIRRVSGLLPATLATGLLLGSPGFLELSASCMLEIPALALAVAALCLLLVVRGKLGIWEGRRDAGATFLAVLGAGGLFGAALLMKLDTIIYLPLAAVILWLRTRDADGPPTDSKTAADGAKGSNSLRASANRRGSASLLLFAASLAVSFVAIDCLIDGGAFLRHFQQSWISHFAPAKSFEYGSAAAHPFQAGILLKNWDTTIPAVVGVLVSLAQARKACLAMLPVAWLGLMLAVFTVHRPWWSYYYIHIAIPLCWCAAVGIGAVWRWARRRRSAWRLALLAVYAVAALAWTGGRVYLQIAGIRHSPQTYSELVLAEIERLKPYTEWLFADEPI